ncbi:MAG: glutamine--fructose-6-phosphate transaminase (isomerizing) [Lachnospiraceae bacterium]|nr:glutamine--fructose-6-phosphate transaminase (isomerizing) [Lachnospiraceae bacterium]
MCGIVGYIGKKQAAPILLDGLSKLEYRGYDSAGIAVRNGEAPPVVVKAKGRLSVLFDKTDGGQSVTGTCGIGHTRWATHGEPTEINAHPHASDDMNVVAVHNGIIENFQELKDKLLRNGYTFQSETDTEVAVKLIDYYYKKYQVGPIDAIAKTMVRVRGSYALAVMFKDYPGEIYAARKDSPMILGIGEGENFLASDVPAILQYTRKVIYMDNYEMVRLTPDAVEVYDLNGDVNEKPVTEITWDAEAAEKGGYEHFMMKEIHEQPKVIRDTISSVVKGEPGSYTLDLSGCGLSQEELKKVSRIWYVACGSAYHAGLCAQYVMEDLAEIPVRTELASEFRYRKMGLAPDDLVVVISQSGETADTLAALRKAKEAGVKTLAIVNVVGSSIAREADYVLYTLAGPEIAVATTKAYSCQLVAGDLLAIAFAQVLGRIGDEQVQTLLSDLVAIPDKVEKIIEDKERIQWFASKFAHASDAFVIGRGLDYAIAMEGSLKMKEISYIHSEAYAAGELKHGTISLVEPGTLVIGVATQPELLEKTVSNMVETGARGAYLCAVTFNGNYSLEDRADFVTYIPKTDAHLAASLAVIPLQLLSYYMSVNRGLDVDKPRNLAKSVTVE